MWAMRWLLCNITVNITYSVMTKTLGHQKLQTKSMLTVCFCEVVLHSQPYSLYMYILPQTVKVVQPVQCLTTQFRAGVQSLVGAKDLSSSLCVQTSWVLRALSQGVKYSQSITLTTHSPYSAVSLSSSTAYSGIASLYTYPHVLLCVMW
jgi:hypothetical protein